MDTSFELPLIESPRRHASTQCDPASAAQTPRAGHIIRQQKPESIPSGIVGLRIRDISEVHVFSFCEK